MPTQESKDRLEPLQGALDLLILRTLICGSQHGQGIARAIQPTSDEELLVEHGALYPALQPLEERGWMSAKCGVSTNNRKAPFYSLTYFLSSSELRRVTLMKPIRTLLRMRILSTLLAASFCALFSTGQLVAQSPALVTLAKAGRLLADPKQQVRNRTAHNIPCGTSLTLHILAYN